MGVNIHISDSKTKTKAKVTDDGALLVSEVVQPPPEVGAENKQQFLSQLMADSGAATDMAVDGSVTPVVYTLEASQDYDIHIQQITIILSDSAVTLKNFGAITGVTNGFDLEITESGTSTFMIEKAKTGGALAAASGFGKPFGDGTTAFIIPNWSGNNDAQAVNVPVGEWVPNGIRIGRGTQDKLTATINDDLTGLLSFDVRIFGYKNIPTT